MNHSLGSSSITFDFRSSKVIPEIPLRPQQTRDLLFYFQSRSGNHAYKCGYAYWRSYGKCALWRHWLAEMAVRRLEWRCDISQQNGIGRNAWVRMCTTLLPLYIYPHGELYHIIVQRRSRRKRRQIQQSWWHPDPLMELSYCAVGTTKLVTLCNTIVLSRLHTKGIPKVTQLFWA